MTGNGVCFKSARGSSLGSSADRMTENNGRDRIGNVQSLALASSLVCQDLRQSCLWLAHLNHDRSALVDATSVPQLGWLGSVKSTCRSKVWIRASAAEPLGAAASVSGCAVHDTG